MQAQAAAFARKHPVWIRVALGLVVLVGSIALLVRSQRVPPEKAKAIGARLELAAGEVKVGAAGQSGAVSSGVPLPTGAEIETGKGARALVRLADGSTVLIRAGSRIVLGDGGIELAAGEAWLDAPPDERGGLSHKLGDITVSAADAGLSIRRDGASASVYVARGLAVVTAPGGRVEVSAGEEAKIDGGAKPVVAPVAFWSDWTGGLGDRGARIGEGAGSGTIYGVDRDALPGTPARALEISRQAVRAVVRDGIAETEVDQTFGNPGGRTVEGWYWFAVPPRAMVTSFAVETDGRLVEGEVIERQEAATRYERAVRSAHEPALLEWIDGRSYRARIYPVPASGSRRVVLRYMELSEARAGKTEYVYPLAHSGADPVAIGELSITVDLGDAGVNAQIATLADAIVEDRGRRVTMRRSGFVPRADFQVEVTPKKKVEPFRVARFAAGAERADYLMARWTPEVDWAGIGEPAGDVVVVVDTSASADEAARQQKAVAAEAVLRAMAPSDHFALLALDTAPTVLYPKDGLAEATDGEIAKALERLAEHSSGGATDLGALFDVALGRVHGKEQPAVVYVGDGLPTSGEIGGVALAERMRRSLSGSRARFFAVGVGDDANHPLLAELARAGGGQYFRVDDPASATAELLRLTSAIKTPTVTDLAIDLGAGLDEPLISVSGKVSRGEEVVLLARTHHPLPTTATVKGRLGGKDFTREYPIELDTGASATLVPRLWAMEKVRRLLGDVDPEAHRGKIVELGLDYGLTTPFTSVLALESEEAYRAQGIQRRRSPLRGVRLTELTPTEEREIDESFASGGSVSAMGCSKRDAPEATEQATPPIDVPKPAAAPVTVAATAAAEEPASGSMDREGQDARPTTSPARVTEGRRGFDGDRAQEPAPSSAPGGRGAGGKGKVEAKAVDDGIAKERGKDEPTPPQTTPRPPPPPPGKQAGGGLGAGKNDKGGVVAGLPARPDTTLAKQVAPLKKRPPEIGACSDAARRPLAERVVLWSRRIKSANNTDELVQRYEGARVTCELGDWRAEQAMLELLQAKVTTEGGATTLLGHFDGDRDKQRYVARALLRRAVDPAMAAAVRRVLFAGGARWPEIDNELAALPTPADRVAKLREVLLASPGDPEGEVRLVRLLAEADKRDEALAAARRLRERGLVSPAVALDLGDALARAGFEEDAIRTYSEIVEFDPGSAPSRRLLGDVYLRHGWHAAAYRQYKTLTEAAPADALGWLRLAAAAAGSGRVDEALRLERQVASAEGRPGPDDPRGWARLSSAARIARLLSPGEKDPKPDAAQTEGLTRKLKELGLFSGPGALVVLSWEDYAATMRLVPFEGEKQASVGDVQEALPAGVTATVLSAADLARVRWIVRPKDDGPRREVAFVVSIIVWDGKAFQVKALRGKLGEGASEARVDG